jgi:hypothetical protein
MITYKKNMANDDTARSIGLFRSVIFNADENLVCFAPPKSMSYDKFKSMGEYDTLDSLVVDEFIDGTMINLFWDGSLSSGNADDANLLGGGWHIATRKNIGASNYFYRYSNNSVQRSFGDMFRDAFVKSGIDIDQLDNSHSYSFVLRHPENRVVTYVTEPELYLVDVFLLESTISDSLLLPPNQYAVTVVPRSTYRTMPAFSVSSVKFPREFIVDSYEQLEKMVLDHSPDGTLTKGYVIRCPITNLRTKIVPEEYEFVKELRGNFADMRLLFLTLCKQKRVHEYLHYYPENYSFFAEYSHLRQDYTHCMFMLYKECFISKNKPLVEYPANFRTHMYKIHGIYKQYYYPRKGRIRFHDVEDYVSDLDPPLLFNTMFVPK